ASSAARSCTWAPGTAWDRARLRWPCSPSSAWRYARRWPTLRPATAAASPCTASRRCTRWWCWRAQARWAGSVPAWSPATSCARPAPPIPDPMSDSDPHSLRHVASDSPRIMVVDGSRLVRRLIGDVLRAGLANVDVVECEGLAEAQAALEAAPVDLVTTSRSEERR